MFKDNIETKEVVEYFKDSENIKSKIKITPEGKRHGVCVYYYENGNISSIQNFVQDTLWGKQETFYPNGDPKEVYDCLKNEKEGLYKSFYNNEINSIKEKLMYRDGEKCGPQEIFHENKNPKQQQQMRLGKQVGSQKHFWSNGNLQLIYNINEHGFPEGTLERYYENGNIEVVSIFSNNKRNGAQKEYYETGELKREMIYKDNELDGIQKHFDKEANVINQCTYDLGKKID